MEEQLRKLRRSIRYYYILGLRKARPLLHVLRVQYERVREYYRTHPRARKWTLILGPPFGAVFLLFLVVWIETPSNKELRNIQNQQASEVYSADSVLLGRYYIQDRTEVKYADISPMVFDALIATEDVRFYEHEG